MVLRSRLQLAALAVCLLALTAGCLGGLSDNGEADDEIDEPAAAEADEPADDDESPDEPSTEELIDGLESSHEHVDTIQGTQVITQESDDGVEQTVSEIIERPPAEQRQEIIETDSPHESAGDVILVDEDGFQSYDSEENVVTKNEFTVEQDEQAPFDDAFLNESMISYEGTATVADRETYVIEYTLDEFGEGTTTMWLDQEYWYPLKHESTTEYDGEQTTTVVEFEDVTFNEELPADAFTIDAPDDAEVETIETPDIESYESIEAAETETGIEVPHHELPDGFELDSVQHTDGEEERLTIWYEDGDESLHVTVESDSELPPTEDYESIDIDDREGYVNEFGEASAVAVQCGDTVVSLFGSVDSDELTAIAETLDC